MDKSDSFRPAPATPSRTSELGPGTMQIDPEASAALAAAVRSARPDQPASATEPPAPAKTRKLPVKGSILAQSAAALLLIGAGWLASYTGTLGTRDAIRQMEAEAARSHEILAKLSDDLAALKRTTAAARDVQQTSSIAASGQAKLAEKIDRLAVAVQDPGKKLTSLEERLTRMEGQITASLNSLSAAKPAPTPPQQTAPPVPPAPTPAEPVEGWVLREVSNGTALVEGRTRGLYEVVPGNVIPGVGRVEAIERRGGRWVVVTAKGVIGTTR
ncbi:hypothetical protein [Microvirga pakistanensis]|uniref:hypothetical protein n=1 Tax=Microvirga pakistanensis TaxID=1682650 RepID=UPI00106D789A|nr:hypothetical protein [Microvirga pakistanensis]